MKNIKYLLFMTTLLILVIMTLVVFIGFSKINLDKKNSALENTNNKSIQKNTNNSFSNQEGSKAFDNMPYVESNSGTSGGGGGGSGGSASNSGNSNPLPDVSSQPCGYYYVSYGICNGTCPKGVCVTENRSCYCKEE